MRKRAKKKADRLLQTEHLKSHEDRRDAVCRTDSLGIIHCDESRKDEGFYAELTPEGFLKAKGRISRTGPQLYTDTEGNEWIEYRPEEEVFSPESIKSFEMSIVTDEHPPEMISSANVSEYQKGTLGNDLERNGKYLEVTILITDKDLITKILNGDKVELSCGYWTVVIDKEGVCPETGTPYNKVQTDILGNHVAVVDEGRAGPECRLYLDSNGAYSTGGLDNMKKNTDAKVMLGDKEFEVPDEVAAKMKELMAKVEELSASPEGDEEGEEKAMDQEGEEKPEGDEEMEEEKLSMDALKAQIDMLKAQVKTQSFDSGKIDARVNLVANARNICDSAFSTEGKKDSQIMAAVVKAVTPSMDLKGKSADYIKAAYDMALAAHKKSQDSNRELFGLVANADKSNDLSASKSLDSLRAKMYGGAN